MIEARKLSIIIPAYNEERRIKKTLINYCSYFKQDTEIIVIPNNCSDNTVAIVKELQKKYSNLQYKEFPKKIWKGGAILEGFDIAHGKYIGYVDADNSTEPKEFERLSNCINDFDGVIASRKLPGSKIITQPPMQRRFASRIFNIVVRILFLFPYRDTQCGAKIFKKSAIKGIKDKIRTKDWAFDIDLLYTLKKQNKRIYEVPSEWKYQTNSKLQLKQAGIKMLFSVLKLRLYYSPLQFFFS